MRLTRGNVEGRDCFVSNVSGSTRIAWINQYPIDTGDLIAGNFVHYTGIIEPRPLVIPSKVVCVGRNYSEHAAELGNEVPDKPLLFLKAPSSVTETGKPIEIPPQSAQVEHEGELAIVIGRAAKNIGEDDDPFQYVLGYSCLNDVTARDLQKSDGQFARAKSFDTFCPVGPHIETDLDVSDLSVRVSVNGEVRQDGRTSQMVFDIPYLLRYISCQMTLLPGDIIATGTPSGVSQLTDGDLCEVEIEGIGTLSNPILEI